MAGNLTDASKSNDMGKKGENRVENFLKKHGFEYERGGRTTIDFKILTSDGIVYADVKNQNVSGTAEEKIPHCSHKYWKKYGYHTMYIIQGDWQINKSIYKHLEEAHKAWGYKTIILSFEKFFEKLLNGELIAGTQQSSVVDFFDETGS